MKTPTAAQAEDGDVRTTTTAGKAEEGNPRPRGLTQEGTVARGANPEDKPAPGDRQRRSPNDRTTGSPLQLLPDEGRHGFPHATGSHLVGVKMVGVRSAHPHPHLNPHLCASFLLPTPPKSCGDVEWWWAQAKDVAGSV